MKNPKPKIISTTQVVIKKLHDETFIVNLPSSEIEFFSDMKEAKKAVKDSIKIEAKKILKKEKNAATNTTTIFVNMSDEEVEFFDL
jgi:hypothetical protein